MDCDHLYTYHNTCKNRIWKNNKIAVFLIKLFSLFLTWFLKTLIEDRFWWKMIFEWRRQLMDDDLWWTTFNKRLFRLKTTFNGRQPLVKNTLWWKKIFDGIWSLNEDTLYTRWHWWKTLWQKTPCDGRQGNKNW